MKIVWLIAAFLGGTLLSVACYFLAKWVLRHRAGQYAAVSAVRQVLGVGYLAALFFLGRNGAYLPWLLIGGALGVTAPALLLTVKLVRVSDEKKQEGEDNDG